MVHGGGGHSRRAGARVIARVWRGRSDPSRAGAYRRHFSESVRPTLEGIPGHRGALLLERNVEPSGVEFVAITFWESMAAVRAFAGPDPEAAVVEPAARAALTEFDSVVRHFTVALDRVPV